MPQLNTFVSNNELMGVPFDSSFLVTTVNSKDFAKAGITTMPTTLAGFTAALQKVGKANGIASPLDIQFATAEGLSTCWYQMTAAFGGQVLTAQDTPAFTSPSSPGYQAMAWMVNAYKSGLVPKANINTTDYQGFTTEEAKNRTAAALCDYSGSVASIYNVPSSSSVVNETEYIPTPGATGVGLNVANPDGIGIPKTAKNVAGAVKFINWFTSTENQAIWAGLKGPNDVVSTFPLPARLSSFNLLAKAGNIAQAAQLEAILKAHAQAPFPNGAPPWYVQFSAAVQTNIHEAAAGPGDHRAGRQRDSRPGEPTRSHWVRGAAGPSPSQDRNARRIRRPHVECAAPWQDAAVHPALAARGVHRGAVLRPDGRHRRRGVLPGDAA